MTFDALLKLKAHAVNTNVPIIQDEGLLVLYDVIKRYENPRVLEIGAAIGYSAIAMALKGACVDTLERDYERYMEAKKHIQAFGLENQIKLIFKDALDDEMTFDHTFDIIFIDAAKAQYEKFFNKYSPFLSRDGVIVCDNLNFHHLNPDEVSRSTRQLLGKLSRFKTFLKTNTEFDTVFLDQGDGMSLSKRRI